MTLAPPVLEQVGRVVGVYEVRAGSVLAAALINGATVLTVESVDDFADDGGELEVILADGADTTAAAVYVGVDRDALTVRLTTPWAGGSYSVGDLVWVSPAAVERRVDVALDGEDDQVVPCRVPFSLSAILPQGVRPDGEGEWVRVAVTDYGYELVDVLGEVPTIEGELIPPDSLPAPEPEPPTDGIPPASSPAVTITPGIGVLFARWTAIANADPVTYEVHVSTSSGFTPAPATLQQLATGTAATIRTTAAGVALAAATTYYVRLVARDDDGSAGPGTQGSGQVTVIASDGAAPSSSPTPTLTPGIGSLTARWSAAAGTTDLVTYEVHLSVTTGFTPNAGTKVGETAGLGYTILTTAGGTALAYGTTYYCKLIARDVDGAAAAGAQASAAPLAVTSADIAAGTITAADIAANTITAAEIAANAIGADEIQANSIVAGDLQADAVTAGSIAADAITTRELAAEAVHADNLQAVLVMASRIVAGVEAGARIELGNDSLGSYLRAFRADGTTETFYLNGQTGDLFVKGTLAFGESVLSPDNTVQIQTQQIEATAQTPRVQQSKELTWLGTSQTVRWPTKTRPGSLLIAVVLLGDDMTLSASGVGAAPWTAVGTDQSFVVGGLTNRLYVRKIEGSAARTQENVNISGSGDGVAILFEFTGVVTVSAQDQIGAGTVASDDVLTVTTPTTTQADELILGFFGFESVDGGIIFGTNYDPSVHRFVGGAMLSAGLAWFADSLTTVGVKSETVTEADAQNVAMVGKLVTFKAVTTPTSTVPTPDVGMTSLFTKLSPTGTESKLAYKDDAGIEHLLTGFHGAYVYATTNQIVGSGANVPLDFNAESFKTIAGMHDNITSNPRLIVPPGMSGLWRVTIHVEWDADATQHSGPVVVAIRKNGTSVRSLRQIGHTNLQGLQFSWIGPLAVGDYMQAYFSSPGEARTVQGGTAGDTSFSFEYLGPVEGV